MYRIRAGRLPLSALFLTVAACSGDGGGTDPGPRTGSVVGQVSMGGTAVQGAQVALSGGAARTTGSSGEVRFDSLQPGGYTLTVQQLPAGFTLGTEAAAKSVTVTAGQTASVGWSVARRPGTLSAVITHGGGGIPGVQVSLPGAATQTTDMTGKVTFANVQPGDHALSIQLPQRFALGGEPASKSVKVEAGQNATLTWAVACPGASSTVTEIKAEGVSFNPANVTVPVCGKVRWVYSSGPPHDVASEGGLWPTADLSGPGKRFEFTFNGTGSFRYRCTPHSAGFTSGMVGVVTVE